MSNVFHTSPSLRLACSLALAWPMALIALFLAVAWFPYNADSAAGDLSWTSPAMATLSASVGAVHCLSVAAPQWGRSGFGLRALAATPAILALVCAAITWARA